MNSFVLDTSVVLAFFNKEIGGQVAQGYFENALISTVNLAEVQNWLTRNGHGDLDASIIMQSENIQIVDFDEKQALIAGKLVEITKSFGLSLGDRACLALATAHKCKVVTADKIWLKLEVDLEIISIR